MERLLDVDVQTYLPDDLLVKMDIATMAHSLEARSPLLDPAMMELAAALRISVKLDGGTTKRIFKQAMRDWLPEGIVDRWFRTYIDSAAAEAPVALSVA